MRGRERETKKNLSADSGTAKAGGSSVQQASGRRMQRSAASGGKAQARQAQRQGLWRHPFFFPMPLPLLSRSPSPPLGRSPAGEHRRAPRAAVVGHALPCFRVGQRKKCVWGKEGCADQIKRDQSQCATDETEAEMRPSAPVLHLP